MDRESIIQIMSRRVGMQLGLTGLMLNEQRRNNEEPTCSSILVLMGPTCTGLVKTF